MHRGGTCTQHAETQTGKSTGSTPSQEAASPWWAFLLGKVMTAGLPSHAGDGVDGVAQRRDAAGGGVIWCSRPGMATDGGTPTRSDRTWAFEPSLPRSTGVGRSEMAFGPDRYSLQDCEDQSISPWLPSSLKSNGV